MHNLHGERFFGMREPAWHKLGFISQVSMSAVEALSVGLKGGYWYEKRPEQVFINGAMSNTGKYAVVRSAVPDDPQEKIIGHVTDRYDIIQPLEIAEMFDEHVAQPVETMGLLLEGQKMFLTWSLREFELFTGDKINCFGLISCGYDGLVGTSLHTVLQRVVCDNTLQIALGEQTTGTGKGKLFTARHISPNMRRDLAEWMSYVQGRALTDISFQAEQMNRLAKETINQKQAADYFELVFPYPVEVNPHQPEVIFNERTSAWRDGVAKADEYRDLAMQLFSGAGTDISSTMWGAVNAVTELVDWGMMTKKPANHSVILGDRAKIKADAWNIAVSGGVK